MRTARLKEAEEAYRKALPIYEAIEARLGEANTLAGLGNLELSREQPLQAFERFRAAHRISTQVEDSLGIAAAHGYMGRAAALAGNVRRAAALSGRAWQLLSGIDDRFGQILALRNLASALAELKRLEAASAALMLAWEAAVMIGDPLAEQLKQSTGLDAPPNEVLLPARTLLTGTLSEIEAELQAAGEDLYAPLSRI